MLESPRTIHQAEPQERMGMVPGDRIEQERLFRLGRERVKAFWMDETVIRVGNLDAFLFIAYEPFEDRILGLYFGRNPNSMFVELLLRDLVRKYGRHQV